MTVDQRPAGRPGTAPRGPAGPHPEPTGPKNPSPRPVAPPPPSPPQPSTGSGVLLALDDGLAALLANARLIPPGETACEVVAEELLAHHLRMARRQLRRRMYPNSGRGGKDGAVESAASASRPVEPPAGQKPPLSGGVPVPPRPTQGFLLPQPPRFEIGGPTPLYDALPALTSSLNRRAD